MGRSRQEYWSALVASSISWRSSWHRGQTHISGISCIIQWVLYHWATREAEKADTMSQTKRTDAGDPHIPSQTPHHFHAIHSDFQHSQPPSSCERCPRLQNSALPMPMTHGSAWELSSPSFTIHSLFGKADSGAFLLCESFLKSSQTSSQYCFCFMFWFFGCVACGILVPQPRIKPIPLALEGEVLATGPPEKSWFGGIFKPHVHDWVSGRR